MPGIVIHTPLLLASASAIRASMLKAAGLSFSVVPAGIDEAGLQAEAHNLKPADQALMLAKAKGLHVAREYPDHVVIAADQICELDGRIFGKPGDFESAAAQLSALQGKTHFQHSGACIVRGQQVVWSDCSGAALTMRPLSRQAIEAYLGLDQPFASCGSYKFEQHGRWLFEKVEGDHDVIKGLPLLALLSALQAMGAAELA